MFLGILQAALYKNLNGAAGLQVKHLLCNKEHCQNEEVEGIFIANQVEENHDLNCHNLTTLLGMAVAFYCQVRSHI